MNDGEYKINTLKKQHVSKGKGVIAHIWAWNVCITYYNEKGRAKVRLLNKNIKRHSW
jgi:hypothetical protein